MKNIAVIPARYNSTRLPAKMMQSLGDKSLIRTTYDNILSMQLFDQVMVATDSQEIFNEITNHGGIAVMTQSTHETGSDRIAEVIAPLDIDIVVNVQGDEPFINKKPLEDLLSVFQSDQSIDVATLKMSIVEPNEIANPNNVKVVCDTNEVALYFSRSPIPFLREPQELSPAYFQHIGVYAFRKKALLAFTGLKMRELEKSEKIECLRYLEYGMKIKVIETAEKSLGIDTQEDLDKARILISNP